MQIIRIKGINSLGKTEGCEKAPVKILDALEDIGTNEKGKLVNRKLMDLEEIHVNNKNVEEANELIYKNSRKAFETQDRVFFVGGDHSISYSLVRGFKEIYQKGNLIVFDAHADCMKPGKEPTHEEWLRKLVEEGFSGEKIVLVGARNIWPEEKEFLSKNNIQVIEMRQVYEDIEGVCDMIMEKVRGEGFYISVDVDVADPAFAPGTGYLEPGGMSSRQLIYFLQRLALLKNFRGADIVEVNPDIEERRTVKLGAKILSELI
jgi:formiminoglutamase